MRTTHSFVKLIKNKIKINEKRMSKNIQFRRGSKQDYDAIKASGNTDSHDIYLVGGSQHPDIVTTTGADGQSVSTQETKPLTMYVGDESVKTEATNTILQEDLIVTNKVGAGSLKTYAKGTNIETILKELLSVEAWPTSGKKSTNYYSLSNLTSSIDKPTSTTPSWHEKVVIYGSKVAFGKVNSSIPTVTTPKITYKNFTYGYYDAVKNEYKTTSTSPSSVSSKNVTLSTTATMKLNATFSGFKDIKVNENGERIDENGNVLDPESMPVLIDKAAMNTSNDFLISGATSGPSLAGSEMIVGLGSNSAIFKSIVKINAEPDSEVPTEKQTELYTASITCGDKYYVLSNYGRYVDVTNGDAIYCTVAPGDQSFTDTSGGDFNSDALSYSITGVYPIYTNSTNDINYINKGVDWLAENKSVESASNNASYTSQFVANTDTFLFLFGKEEGVNTNRMKFYVPASKAISKIDVFNDSSKSWMPSINDFETTDTTDIQISENVKVTYNIWTPKSSVNEMGSNTFVRLTLSSKTSSNT